MKYLLLILALGLGAELKAQEIVLYPDSFYRYEFSSKESFEKMGKNLGEKIVKSLQIS